MDTRWDDGTAFRDWFRVLKRERRIVLTAVVVVPIIAAAVSLHQAHEYQASARVLVNQQGAAAGLLGLTGSQTPPDRYAATQADLAGSGQVAELAVKAAHVPGRTAPGLLAATTVSADPLADLLTITVTDRDPRAAERLATAYAKAFVVYQRNLGRAELTSALVQVRNQLAGLSGDQLGSPLGLRLRANERDLEVLQALNLSGGSAVVVGPAASAELTQPKTIRNVALGVVVGAVLGIALAFMREALDTRLRTVEELRDQLMLPLLGHLRRPARGLRRNQRLVTIWEPDSAGAEAFRMLRNNLAATLRELGAGSLMVTSAVRGEGRSTTAANLAVVLARSGRHVILVDMDVRRPCQHRLFALGDRPGLSELALEEIDVDDALCRIDIDTRPRDAAPVGETSAAPQAPGRGYHSGNGTRAKAATVRGRLNVLTAGQTLTDPGEFLSGRAVARTMKMLGDRCDLLLLDAPPLLAVGDAVTIAEHADGLLLVTRLGFVQREKMPDLRRALEACRAHKLGFVATDSKEHAVDSVWSSRLQLPPVEAEPESPSTPIR
jgi:Mrp family chromosome partitioning ATPase/capsular polysaccharide biosynthesis protein